MPCMVFEVICELAKIYSLNQGCQTQFLEDRSPAEFSSNPAPKQTMQFSVEPKGESHFSLTPSPCPSKPSGKR